MTERSESKDRDAPASESGSRRPGHAGTAASIGQELGKLDFEPDALLEGLFDQSSVPAPPPVGERESFSPVPVPPSVPPAVRSSVPPGAPHFADDDEQTSVFWRSASAAPPERTKGSLFESAPPDEGSAPHDGVPPDEHYLPESFRPPDAPSSRAPHVASTNAPRSAPASAPRIPSPSPARPASVAVPRPASAAPLANPFAPPREPDEAERTMRRSVEPSAALPSQPPEPNEAERTARRSVEPVPEHFPSEAPTATVERALFSAEPQELDEFAAELPSQPPEMAEPERTVRRTLEPMRAFPSQPPEVDEAERTMRRSPIALAPTVPPTRGPTRSSAAPPLLQPGEGVDPLSPSAWLQRAEWLESEARAAQSPEAKARALVVASELWALAGDVRRGREVAIEAAATGRSASLGDRQLRWLAALEGDFQSVVTALEAEQLGAATQEARAHAAYLAAEITRLVQNDDPTAKQRHELAARAHPEDPRPSLMRLVDQLTASNGPPKLRWPERPEFAELARATDELARLRSPVGGNPGTPLGSFEDALSALSVGQRSHAANSVLELMRVPGMGSAPLWLAAALLAADDHTRPESLALFERLSAGAGDPTARRALAAHALAAGDASMLERALAGGADALPAEDRAALRLLGGHSGPELEASLAELLEREAAPTLVAAAMLAGDADAIGELPLPSSPERDQLALGRALVRNQGDPLAAGGEIPRALEAFVRTNPDDALGRVLGLELALSRRDAGMLARELGAWPAAVGDGEALCERALAEAIVHDLGGDTVAAREAYERALDLDPACEPAARALLDGVAPGQVSELLLRLAEAETRGARAAVYFLEAALNALESEVELFEPALERAREADPGLFLSYRLGEERAREVSDPDRLLAWIRSRRAHVEDRSEAALLLVREALLTVGGDAETATALLKEAFESAPDDVSLLDLYTRFGPKDAPGQGASWEALARRTSGPLAAELYLIAALEYERENDRNAACRAAERAGLERGDPLARPLAERLGLGGEGSATLSGALRGRLVRAENSVEKRELCERLAELERARDDQPAAIAFLRAGLEYDPGHLPSLRALERAALLGADKELLAETEAALTSLLTGADAAAAAEIAIRLLPEGAAPDRRRLLAELAFQQRPDALWALRTLATDVTAPAQVVFNAYRELATLATRPLDKATLSLRAAEAALRNGQFSDARVVLDQAIDEVPNHLVALVTLAELLERAGDPAEAARAFEAVAEASRVDAHKAAAFQRAAVLWLDQGSDPDRGLLALEQAASIDITNEEAVLRLQSIYVTRGERHKLADLLARRVDQASDPEIRMALEVARSRVLAEVGEHASAKAALSAALDAQPDHQEALQTFAHLCLAEGDWLSAEQALLRLARHAGSPEVQADVYRRLAELYDTNLPNPERAELAYREVLRRTPDDASVIERLIGVYARTGRKEDALKLSLDFLERAATPELRRQRTADHALVLERVANDRRQAEAVLDKARREAPHDARLLRAAVEVRRRAGEDNQAKILLDRAASDARRALGTGRFELSFFETLAAVAELKGQPEAARIAHSTLASLSGNELPLVGAGAIAGSPALDDLLAPELLDPRIRTLIHRSGPALDRAYPADLRALRATPLPPGSLAYFAHAQKVAESFELDTIEILVSPSVGMNVVPLSSSPARLLIGPELLRSSDDAVRFALLVRALKVLQVHGPVIARTSPVELVPLFGGLVASLVPDGAPQPGVDARKAKDAANRIAPALSPELIEELAPLAREIAPLVSTRSSQLGSAILQWAARTALLAVGDLFTLLSAISRASGLSSGLPASGPERVRFIVRNPEARDLSIFSVSDHYAEARKRLELGS